MTDEPKKVHEMMGAALSLDVANEKKYTTRAERYQEQLERERKFESGELLINLPALRGLTYQKGGGQRKAHMVSFNEEVWNKVREIVPVGPGQYGSAFIEVGTKLLIALVVEDKKEISKIVDALGKTTHIDRTIEKLYQVADLLKVRYYE